MIDDGRSRWRSYHVESDAYPEAERAIHHTWAECPLGARIHEDDRWTGTGRKPLCPLCERSPD